MKPLIELLLIIFCLVMIEIAVARSLAPRSVEHLFDGIRRLNWNFLRTFRRDPATSALLVWGVIVIFFVDLQKAVWRRKVSNKDSLE